MAELLLSETLFSFKLRQKSHYWLRILAFYLVSIGVAFAFPILAYDGFYSSFMFFCFFAVTILLLKFAYDEPWIDIFFSAAAGYTTQHLAYELFSLIAAASRINEGNELSLYGSGSSIWGSGTFYLYNYVFYFGSYSLVYWLSYLIFGMKIKRNEELMLKNREFFPVVGLLLMVDIVLNAFMTYHSYANYDRVYIVLFRILNIACCSAAMTIQFKMVDSNKLEQELDTTKRLLHLEKEQYSINKENIDLINMKCHDLKHQIRQIAGSASLSPKTIEDIENTVSIYDSNVKTGNEPLDLILTEKSLICKRNNIQLTCVVDGSKLSFMASEDLYSLFGNAIDNAIEAVRGIEQEKRIIGLNVREAHRFITINIHNYYDGTISFSEDGVPKTTKAEKDYHGFGIKSIRYIAQKYDGDIAIEAKNNVFNLNVLIPEKETLV
jgi:hypothetical protein